MIDVNEKLDGAQSYSWSMLHPGDLIKNPKWITKGDYALVVSRTEDQVVIYRFGIGCVQTLRSTDCPGESFYKYDADLIITKRV